MLKRRWCVKSLEMKSDKSQTSTEASLRLLPRIFSAATRKPAPLDHAKLCARACQKTGLKNFGNPPLEPALSTLVSSLEHEASLHPLGRFLIGIHLEEILQSRLKFASRCEEAAVSRKTSPPPIFITGMPRSGSTFLHELLCQTPGMQAPRVWEVMSPAEAATPDRGWRDGRIWKAAWCLWWFRRLAPGADAVYPMRARTPHECVAIQSYTFLSEEFISTCHVPSYEAFLRNADLRPAYTWQKCFLQMLQSKRPAARWILKSPDHVHGLDALFSVFPDALIIQTHRNPLDSLRSSIQLTGVLHGLYGHPQSPHKLAEREARNMAQNLERLIQFRDSHPALANRFIDVNYSELTSNPLAVVRRIFKSFEIPLSEDTISKIQQFARSRSAYKGRRTAATLTEVGLDLSAQLASFGEYCRRFGIPNRPAPVFQRAR